MPTQNPYRDQMLHTNMMRASDFETRRIRIGKKGGSSEHVFSLCSGGCFKCQTFLEFLLGNYLGGLDLEMTKIPQDLPAAAPAQA